MKAGIIGSGVGGLLSALELARMGYDVEVFERLPILGGRFTNLEYKGFQLSTGALHMIPHGPRGPFAQLLRDAGAEVEIISSVPMAVIRIPKATGFQDLPFKDFPGPLSKGNRLRLALLALRSKLFRPRNDISFRDWLTSYLENEYLARLAGSFFGWSLSLPTSRVPAWEALAVIDSLYKYKGPGIPKGGCGAVTGALVETLESLGGKVHKKSRVERIILEKGAAKGLVVKGGTIKTDIIISDLGHQATSMLYEVKETKYLGKVSRIQPSSGIKISLAADELLIGHTGVLFTPYSLRVNGLNEVTNADPNLAPKGKHLIMSHQTLLSRDLKREIEFGFLDLKTIFPGKKYEVLIVQTYHDAWPVNRAASGMDIGNETPIKNLYIVGDGAKVRGGIEVEGIALGVQRVVRLIEGAKG